jgi:hypothetical protein
LDRQNSIHTHDCVQTRKTGRIVPKDLNSSETATTIPADKSLEHSDITLVDAHDSTSPAPQWTQYLSYQKYSYESIVFNDFNGQNFYCSMGADGCKCIYGPDIGMRHVTMTKPIQ